MTFKNGGFPPLKYVKLTNNETIKKEKGFTNIKVNKLIMTDSRD
jgi:hypothetical protein